MTYWEVVTDGLEFTLTLIGANLIGLIFYLISGPFAPFVFLEIPEPALAEEQRIVRVFPQGGHVTHVRLPEGTDYLLTTPADFEVQEAVVTAVREGIGLH